MITMAIMVVSVSSTEAQVVVTLKNGKEVSGEIVRFTENVIVMKRYSQQTQKYIEFNLDKTEVAKVFDILSDKDVTLLILGKQYVPDSINENVYENSNKLDGNSSKKDQTIAPRVEIAPYQSRNVTKDSSINSAREESIGVSKIIHPRNTLGFMIGGGYSTISQDDWNSDFITTPNRFYESINMSTEFQEMNNGFPVTAGLRYIFGNSFEVELDGFYLFGGSNIHASGFIYHTVLQSDVYTRVSDEIEVHHIEGRMGLRVYFVDAKSNLALYLRVGGAGAYMATDRSVEMVYSGYPYMSEYWLERYHAYGVSINGGFGVRAALSPISINVGANYRHTPKKDWNKFTADKTSYKNGDADDLVPPSGSSSVFYDMSGIEVILQLVTYL
ncbi:MAG: hypothetical protein M5R41_19315 [Bacteroidia bacterium]|nr:hypothetical protein [Bacteroidia bacterium]